ncbi:MAG: hypothetical protein WA220_06060 [Candidatus Nitrosopolaris sp.]
MLFYIFKVVREKTPVMAVLMITLAIVIATPNITPNYAMSAYAQYGVSVTCGPTQGPNLSVSVSISGLLPQTFIDYKFIRPDNSVVSGGFSTGPYGKNTVAINVGADTGSYLVYIYKDTNSSGTEQQPIYHSTTTLPCIDNHFAGEYYKSHPQLIEYLLGIQSIYNKIKIGDYLVASPRNALVILNSSNSNFAEDQLAAQLFAAELNAVNGGASNCTGEAISSANALLKSQNYNGPTNVLRTSMSEDLHNQTLSYKHRLETYNRSGCER